MAKTAAEIPVLVWLDPSQIGLVRAVADRAGLRIIGAGTSARGRATEVGEALGVAGQDDLRAALAAAEAGLVWLAAPAEFGTEREDIEVLRTAMERGVRIATMEPIPASVLQLAARATAGVALGPAAEIGPPEASAEVARFVPLVRHTGAFAELAEIGEAVGRMRTVAVRCIGSPVEGSLGARLFDALDLVLGLLGEPEAVDAAYSPPASRMGAGLRLLPGESLRGLSGDMTLNLRYAEGRSACILASDQAVRWERSALLLADGGRVTIGDGGLGWLAAGEAGDESGEPRRRKRADAVSVIADALGRIGQGRDGAWPAVDHPGVLSLAGAALLSARTGENESPATIRRMAGMG